MRVKRRPKCKMKSIKSCNHKRIVKATVVESKSRTIGGVVMVELTKSLSYGFIVREDKVEDFLNHKRDRTKLERVLRKANRLQKNIRVHE